MKWVARFKDKVGHPNIQTTVHDQFNNPLSGSPGKTSHDQESEQDFRKFWEEFRSSSSEEEKERALEMAINVFCRLSRKIGDASPVVNRLVDARIFSFMVAKALVTEVNKLKTYNASAPQVIEQILHFLTKSPKEETSSNGVNMLYALQCLVSPPLDVQPLLDAGLLSCLLWVLHTIFGQPGLENSAASAENTAHVVEADSEPLSKLMVEGSIVHIMKALAQHPGATQSLAEDNSLQLLFHIAAMRHEQFSLSSDDSVKSSVSLAQLHRQALQILCLLLNNDNGISAHYIHTHQLVKVLLKVIREFDGTIQDAEYAVDVVDLMQQCVELSCRLESSVRLRDDLHNAHGYRFLVQFALSVTEKFSSNKSSMSSSETEKNSGESLPLVLTRLLDILVNLAQVGASGPQGMVKSVIMKSSGGIGRTFLFSDSGATPNNDEIPMDGKVKDMEAVQVLQDIFLEARNVKLQLEILDRLLRIFSSHADNYILCQELRTLPLFILNMPSLPEMVQEKLLKVLEYAATAVNCNLEQELLSLCCLLQQPLRNSMQRNILIFFAKLLSFDKQYKKVLREVGALEVLIDNLKMLSSLNPQKNLLTERKTQTDSNTLSEAVSLRSISFSSSDTVQFSPKADLFEDSGTLMIVWDFLVSMLKGTEANQAAFRKMNGIAAVLPLLNSPHHRNGVLHLMTCLICEDVKQSHPEELGALIEVVKSGSLANSLGQQIKVDVETKKDILWAIYRILAANNTCKDVFGTATGFSILFTILYSFPTDRERSQGKENSSLLLLSHCEVFKSLINVVKEAVSNNAANRLRLHKIISSQTFKELLSDSGLLCVEHEEVVADLLLGLALEKKSSSGEMLVLSSEKEPNVNQKLEETGTSLVTIPEIDLYDVESPDLVLNAGAIEIVITCMKYFSFGLQLRILEVLKKLSQACTHNRDCITAAGCISLLLEIARSAGGNTTLFEQVLGIVEILGSYRLCTAELRTLVRWIWWSRDSSKQQYDQIFLESMKRMIQLESIMSENSYNVRFIDMSTGNSGYSCMNISLGNRPWPPAAGYSFAFWIRYRRTRSKEHNDFAPNNTYPKSRPAPYAKEHKKIHIFSVGSMEEKSHMYAELYLEESGTLYLATSNTSFLSFKGVILEEGIWQHVVIVHNKPNILAGLFQSSTACLYVNGKLRQTGKLGYSASHVGKSLQATIGTLTSDLEISLMRWSLGACYLFEEVLTSQSVFLIYALGRRYHGLFQDADLLWFLPYEACSGGNLGTFEGLEIELAYGASNQKVEESLKSSTKSGGSGTVWDVDRLTTLVSQLSSKKLIFCFDGTYSDNDTSGGITLVNLLDPLSAAASPFGGLPRIARLYGDITVCSPCSLSESIRKIGGVAVVLALIEVAESKESLHVALGLLVSVLRWSSQNAYDMSATRGYHLLALFLHHRMHHFDIQDLDMLFQIAACGISLFNLDNIGSFNTPPLLGNHTGGIKLDRTLKSSGEEASPFGSQLDSSDIFQQDMMSHYSDVEISDLSNETSNGLILTNLEMMEHVLLDWTLWVAAPVSTQLALLGFIERLVAMHKYRAHNLAMLRRVNIVQHLLITLQRSDVETPVLEKLVVLLEIILEDGLLTSELKCVVDFVIMTFEPPKIQEIFTGRREPGGMHVVVRNMLLEMLIDLQVTVSSEEIFESWHKTVSLKLITYLLDEAVHPTTIRWVMTLVGVCLSSPSNFEMKFRSNGGFQGLIQVLPSFFDCPEIYYILFCLVLGKSVYPRQPEVRMLDFLALMPDNGSSVELLFTDLLEAIVLMSKRAFDRLCLQLNSIEQATDQMQRSFPFDDNFSGITDSSEQLQGEALLHKTYAARLLGGEAASPAVVTSMIRYMVDLAKMCPAFSATLRRQDLLESCCDLYFSCVRAAYAAQRFQCAEIKGRDEFNDTEDVVSAQVLDSMHGQESTVLFERISHSKNLDGNDNMLHSIATRIPDVNYATEDIDHQVSQTPVSVPRHKSENKAHVEAESQFLFTPDSSISEASGLLLRPSYSMSTTPFDLSTSWMGSSSRSETNIGASIATPSTSMNSEVYYRLSSSGDGCLDYLFNELKPEFLLRLESLGPGGGPCSSSCVAVLDLIAEVLADGLSDQIRALSLVEAILETTPFGVAVDTALAFQGLCLGRVMNCFERRLLRDDEEVNKRLDKNKWSSNLDSFSSLLVDCVYTGAFSEPGSVLKVLEFLLSMLQLANKDRRVEEAPATGKGFLSLGRGIGRQVEVYVQGLLKNVNRMIIYGFSASFITAVTEDGSKQEKTDLRKQEDLDEKSLPATVDISSLLQAVISNKHLIFSPINLDTDLACCLCINSINLLNLLCDAKPSTLGQLAGEVMKSLLTFRKPVLEELLVVRATQGEALDMLHNGFDKLVHSNIRDFCVWFQNSKETILKVLDQCASITWMKCVTNVAKFPGIRLKQGESRRKKEWLRRNREISKLADRHWEKMKERHYSLDAIRNSMETDLRVLRQDKYGWLLHAESEWEQHIQQLVHERSILPMLKDTRSGQPDWELCTTEGPYRMRKKMIQCKVKIDMTCVNSLRMDCARDSGLDIGKVDNDSIIHQISIGDTAWSERSGNSQLYVEDIDGDQDIHLKEEDNASSSAYTGFDSAQLESESIRSQAARTSSVLSAQHSIPGELSESIQGSARRSLHPSEDPKSEGMKAPKYMHDDGEYLIRPFLEPGDKIRQWYNCERVAGLEKKDGLFLIGELCLYIIENIYISEQTGHICEKVSKDQLSMIDQAIGVKSSSPVVSQDGELNGSNPWQERVGKWIGARAWAYTGGVWGRENDLAISHMAHPWRKWKLESVHEILKRRYQLRPVAIEIFSTDGCNDLLVFHKNERDEVFKNLVSLNLPRNNMLDATISGTSKEDVSENNGLFKRMAKTFSKRWQNCEISNFQYLMHLNTLAGRGYNDLTQYPVYPWVLADYDSDSLNLEDPKTFRQLNKPMGALSPEREDEFRRRYDNWDDPEIPQFHYGSHYSSAGTVLFYLIRLPPFSAENKKLQGGQFDHADRLFYSVKETWLSASQGNTADVKELIPEFYYLPEMFENRFDFDFGFKQSGEKVNEVLLPPWAKGSAREFVRKHREALESHYVSENLHHWIDLIFGYRQQGQAAVDATNVFFHLTYEDAVDIDSIHDPNMKASILAQINHFGQTPKQLFQKPHPKRRVQNKFPSMNILSWHNVLVPQEMRTYPFPISQVVYFHEKVLASGVNRILKPRSYKKYVAWGFPDKSLRIFSYDQDKLLSTHEGLHGNEQIQCTGISRDGRILVTGGEDGMLSVWRLQKQGVKKQHYLVLQRTLCAHTQKITCLAICQPYSLIVSGSEDCSIILWDLSSFRYVRQLPLLPSAASVVHVNEMTGNIVTAAGTTLAIWSINGDCLATVNTSQLPSDMIISVTNSCFSDWIGADWLITGHQSGSIKIWHMGHNSLDMSRVYTRSQSIPLRSLSRKSSKTDDSNPSFEKLEGKFEMTPMPEYQLTLLKVLKWHKQAVTCVHVTSDLKLLLSGDLGGHIVSWILPEDVNAER